MRASSFFPCMLQREGGGPGGVPLLAQRLDHRRQHQPLDVRARRVVGAELVPLARLQGPLQQRAEDGRLDIGPVALAGLDQQFQLLGGDGQGVAFLEQSAVEMPELAAHGRGEAAGFHVASRRPAAIGNELVEVAAQGS